MADHLVTVKFPASDIAKYLEANLPILHKIRDDFAHYNQPVTLPTALEMIQAHLKDTPDIVLKVFQNKDNLALAQLSETATYPASTIANYLEEALPILQRLQHSFAEEKKSIPFDVLIASLHLHLLNTQHQEALTPKDIAMMILIYIGAVGVTNDHLKKEDAQPFLQAVFQKTYSLLETTF